MRFREATPEDAPAIARVHAESWQRTFDFALSEEYRAGPVFDDRAAVWASRMAAAPPNQYVVLAEEDGSLAGFACAYGADHERWGALLDNLHINADCQGRGLGKKLTGLVAEWCVANYPDDGMYLWVLEKNTRARRMYEKLGAAFVETDTVANVTSGEQWRAPDGGDVVCHRYAWTREAVAEIPRRARP